MGSLARELQAVRRDAEQRALDAHAGVQQLQAALKQLLLGEEKAHAERAALVRAQFAALKREYGEFVDARVVDVHALVAALRAQVDRLEAHAELVHAQLARIEDRPAPATVQEVACGPVRGSAGQCGAARGQAKRGSGAWARLEKARQK